MTVRKAAVLVLLLALVAAGAQFIGFLSHKPVEASPPTVEARNGSIEQSFEASGSFTPLNRVEIKSLIPGRIDALLVDEGAYVKKGQVVAWMSSDDRIAILDAARSKSPAEFKRWTNVYKQTPILSGTAGAVILRNATVGQEVETGAVLFAVSDQLIVMGSVDESDIGRVQLKMPVRITLDAYPRAPLTGTVFEILHEGRNASNIVTYGVKIRPVHIPAFVRAQMTANLKFIVKEKHRTILVPTSAVHVVSGISQVYVPGPDGRPQLREIKVGIENDDRTEVLAGLNPGDKVFLMQDGYMPQDLPEDNPFSPIKHVSHAKKPTEISNLPKS